MSPAPRINGGQANHEHPLLRLFLQRQNFNDTLLAAPIPRSYEARFARDF